MTLRPFKIDVLPKCNLKQKRPLIIPIFLPHMGCPHQCLFCNQTSITGHSNNLPSKASMSRQIERFLSFRRQKRQFTEVSFYGGNFLGLSFDQITDLLSHASKYIQKGHINGIRFSTRPDTIDPKCLELISSFPISTVELGVQSMNDQVLAMVRRDHNRSDIKTAIARLKQTNYAIGLQLMIGLPGDTFKSVMESAYQIADVKPDFVRIYPTLVLKGSPLSKWYQTGKYTPLSLPLAIEQTKSLFLMFQKKGIPTIRMGLQASDELNQNDTLLAGPYHPSFGHLVLSSIYKDAIHQMLSKIFSDSQASEKDRSVQLSANPRDISKVRGLKNQNLSLLKKEFNLFRLKIIPDPDLHIGTLIFKILP
jgi:histone acetyltransferase (RNA polymerase elongator complex component)